MKPGLLDEYLAQSVEHVRQAVLVNHKLEGSHLRVGEIETIEVAPDPRADGSPRAWALMIVGDPQAVADIQTWLQHRYQERIVSRHTLSVRD